MDYISFMELLEQEERICDRAQSVANMLGGLETAAQDGRTSLDRHERLLERLEEEKKSLDGELHEVRGKIAERLDEYRLIYGGESNE